MLKLTLNLSNFTAIELATLETLLRRQHKSHDADLVAEEGRANAGDEYADCQGFADEYFQDYEV